MNRFLSGMVVGIAVSAAAFGGWMKVNSAPETVADERPTIVSLDESGRKRQPTEAERYFGEFLKTQPLKIVTEWPVDAPAISPVVEPMPAPVTFVVIILGTIGATALFNLFQHRRRRRLADARLRFGTITSQFRWDGPSLVPVYREVMIEHLSRALGEKLSRAANELAQLTLQVRSELCVTRQVFPDTGAAWEKAYAQFHGLPEFPETALLPLLVMESIQRRDELPLEELQEYRSRRPAVNEAPAPRDFRRMAENLHSLREKLKREQLSEEVASEIEVAIEATTPTRIGK